MRRHLISAAAILAVLGTIGYLFWPKILPDPQNDRSEPNASYAFSDAITPGDIGRHIAVLASDSLEGRASGQAGEHKAARYIQSVFAATGLKMPADNGIQSFSYKKYFGITYSALRFGSVTGIEQRDYHPYLLSNTPETKAPALFVGFRFNPKNANSNPFRDLDIRDKMVVIFESEYHILSQHFKDAIDGGAAGILHIPLDSSAREVLSIYQDYYAQPPWNTPGFRITHKMANLLLNQAGTTFEALRTRVIDKDERVTLSLPVEVTCELRYSGEDSVHSANVMALLNGAGFLRKNKKQYIVVGAHYDHVGMRTFATATHDSTAIFSGADDNASGVAALLEMASELAASDKKPAHSLLFVAFGAEEPITGSEGSQYLLKNLPIPREQIAYMVNLDMVGRMDSLRTLYVNLYNAPKTLRERLELMQPRYPDIRLVIDSLVMGSDYKTFSEMGIPAVAFSTGYHPQYHTAADTAGLISTKGTAAIADFIADLITTPL
ncbi:MAG: M28 family metallopeptidase [Bacteroidales bacterium]